MPPLGKVPTVHVPELLELDDELADELDAVDVAELLEPECVLAADELVLVRDDELVVELVPAEELVP